MEMCTCVSETETKTLKQTLINCENKKGTDTEKSHKIPSNL